MASALIQIGTLNNPGHAVFNNFVVVRELLSYFDKGDLLRLRLVCRTTNHIACLLLNGNRINRILICDDTEMSSFLAATRPIETLDPSHRFRYTSFHLCLRYLSMQSLKDFVLQFGSQVVKYKFRMFCCHSAPENNRLRRIYLPQILRTFDSQTESKILFLLSSSPKLQHLEFQCWIDLIPSQLPAEFPCLRTLIVGVRGSQRLPSAFLDLFKKRSPLLSKVKVQRITFSDVETAQEVVRNTTIFPVMLMAIAVCTILTLI